LTAATDNGHDDEGDDSDADVYDIGGDDEICNISEYEGPDIDATSAVEDESEEESENDEEFDEDEEDDKSFPPYAKWLSYSHVVADIPKVLNSSLAHSDVLLSKGDVWLQAKITHFNSGILPTFSVRYNKRNCPSRYMYLIEGKELEVEKLNLLKANYGISWIMISVKH